MKALFNTWLIRALAVMLAASVALAQNAFAQERVPFRDEELDQMLAPVALYPDPLLSQILMASTYPLEVVQASRWSRANPRLKVYLRADAKGAWSFETIRPGSYPNSKAPGHIHFEVSASGYARKVFEIVFEGDPLVTAQMRSNPAFSVRPVQQGRVTERIVLTPGL